jgi:hypothetical protein
MTWQWHRVEEEEEERGGEPAGSPGVAAVGLEGVRLGAKLHELHGGNSNAKRFSLLTTSLLGRQLLCGFSSACRLLTFHATLPLRARVPSRRSTQGAVPADGQAGRSPKKHAREQQSSERGWLGLVW